jgi:hypothetical membrane protein
VAQDVARRALPVIGGLFLVGLLGQVFLAGLGVFDSPTSFVTHRNVGYLLGFVTLLILGVAIVARSGRSVIALSVVLIVQFALQSVFVAMRVDAPVVAALHPVNGVLIILVVAAITVLATRRSTGPSPASASTTS